MGASTISLKDTLKVEYSINIENNIIIKAFNQDISHKISIPFSYFKECFLYLKEFKDIKEVSAYLKNVISNKLYDLNLERDRVAIIFYIKSLVGLSKGSVKFFLSKEINSLTLEKVYEYVTFLENRVINLENEIIELKKENEKLLKDKQ